MAVNWYKFNIELLGVAWKTLIWVLTALILIRTEYQYNGKTFMMVPVHYAFMVQYPWLMPTVLAMFIGILWLCYFQAFRIFRADKRYGER